MMLTLNASESGNLTPSFGRLFRTKGKVAVRHAILILSHVYMLSRWALLVTGFINYTPSGDH
jgi:hypothetical protein